jgi:hypothetical protein
MKEKKFAKDHNSDGNGPEPVRVNKEDREKYRQFKQ